MVSGRTPRRQPSFVPAVEAAGVVEAVGAGVTADRAGDRVVYWDPLPRAFAELVAVPAWRADVGEALARITSGNTTGKLLIRV